MKNTLTALLLLVATYSFGAATNATPLYSALMMNSTNLVISFPTNGATLTAFYRTNDIARQSALDSASNALSARVTTVENTTGAFQRIDLTFSGSGSTGTITSAASDAGKYLYADGTWRGVTSTNGGDFRSDGSVSMSSNINLGTHGITNGWGNFTNLLIDGTNLGDLTNGWNLGPAQAAFASNLAWNISIGTQGWNIAASQALWASNAAEWVSNRLGLITPADYPAVSNAATFSSNWISTNTVLQTAVNTATNLVAGVGYITDGSLYATAVQGIAATNAQARVSAVESRTNQIYINATNWATGTFITNGGTAGAGYYAVSNGSLVSFISGVGGGDPASYLMVSNAALWASSHVGVAVSIFSGQDTTGVVTSAAADAGKYLRADGSWATPPGSGGDPISYTMVSNAAMWSSNWIGTNTINVFSTNAVWASNAVVNIQPWTNDITVYTNLLKSTTNTMSGNILWASNAVGLVSNNVASIQPWTNSVTIYTNLLMSSTNMMSGNIAWVSGAVVSVQTWTNSANGSTSSWNVARTDSAAATNFMATNTIYQSATNTAIGPAFVAYIGAAQQSIVAVWTTMSNTMKSVDTDAAFNTNTFIYTIPKTGTWLISAGAIFSTGSGAAPTTGILVSNSTTAATYLMCQNYFPAGQFPSLSASKAIYLTNGTPIRAGFCGVNGTGVLVYGNDPGFTFFSGAWLR
jgi:hypothetical protein